MTHKSLLQLTYIFFFILSYIWWAFFLFWFLCSNKCFCSWVHTSCLTGLWLLLLFPQFLSFHQECVLFSDPSSMSPQHLTSSCFSLFSLATFLCILRKILIRSFLCSGNWTKSWTFKQVLYHGKPSPAPSNLSNLKYKQTLCLWPEGYILLYIKDLAYLCLGKDLSKWY